MEIIEKLLWPEEGMFLLQISVRLYSSLQCPPQGANLHNLNKEKAEKPVQ